MSFLKAIAGLLLVAGLLIGGGWIWASSKSAREMAVTMDVPATGFDLPAPLDEEEVAALGLTEPEADSIARARAIERGRHLINARYGCRDCHGENFGGGVMMDSPPMGRMFGPNLTSGTGSRAGSFTTEDWDRVVRHGILPDGRRAVMPADEFTRMSDQELGDIVTYIQSLPAVDNTTPPVSLGPIGKVLIAMGTFTFSATERIDHEAEHPATPPEAVVSVEFGRHLAATCVGCHRPNYSGGPIIGGDPSWVDARNITPHEDGLAGWSFEQFVSAMRDMKRPDGSDLRMPMTLTQSFAQQMTDVELEAMWTFLQSVPAAPTGTN